MSEIHFWDMDHTVLNNDCDVSWKTFLVSRGYAPVGDLDEAAAFYEEYEQGVLRVELFNAFQLRDFSGKTWDEGDAGLVARAFCGDRKTTVVHGGRAPDRCAAG